MRVNWSNLLTLAATAVLLGATLSTLGVSDFWIIVGGAACGFFWPPIIERKEDE